EGQGVLVVGPNRLFLGSIEQVLPSLGEAGVEMAVLADLVPRVRVTGRDPLHTARIKGDLRMVGVVRRAVADRQRPLRRDLVLGMGIRKVRLRAAESERIVAEAKRRFHTHNGARKFIVSQVYEAIAATHPDGTDAATVKDQLANDPDLRTALNWMWPVLTPAALLHDLYGSEALLRSAGRGSRRTALTDDERGHLFRPWQPDMDFRSVVWTVDDVPVLDEAFERLGPRPGSPDDDESRTYGHIVVDEAQDLSPMQLRMLTRRSLNGSMTVVGDIAQSTGAWAHADWSEVLDHLPDRRPARRAELTVGYRIPGPSMALAAKALRVAAPELSAPQAVRQDGDEPRFVATVQPSTLVDTIIDTAVAEREELGSGNVAVIVPPSSYDALVARFEERQVDVGLAIRDGLDHPITVVPVGVVKGLEVDVAIVVEPQAILDEEPQGARSLYVALTRATKRLVVVHDRALPEFLVSGEAAPTATESVGIVEVEQPTLF
ncbi:MAG: ATP-binding domain-containing protein, partial [Acidimicrobiales bacterium]